MRVHESLLKACEKWGKKRNRLLVKVEGVLKKKKTKYNCSVPLIKFVSI